jgi:predicted transcriptional regulator
MPANTTLTIRLSPKTSARLGRLAETTHRPQSSLAAQAVEKYVASESEIVEGIERGLADMKAGNLVPHDEAIARLGATIAAAKRRRR